MVDSKFSLNTQSLFEMQEKAADILSLITTETTNRSSSIDSLVNAIERIGNQLTLPSELTELVESLRVFVRELYSHSEPLISQPTLLAIGQVLLGDLMKGAEQYQRNPITIESLKKIKELNLVRSPEDVFNETTDHIETAQWYRDLSRLPDQTVLHWRYKSDQNWQSAAIQNNELVLGIGSVNVDGRKIVNLKNCQNAYLEMIVDDEKRFVKIL